MANKLIRPSQRAGRMLDIGCGSYPLTLSRTVFKEKYGIDRVLSDATIKELDSRGIKLSFQDFSHGAKLPFEDGFFDVVTLLAVAEHLDRDHLLALSGEIRRILVTGGTLILTTPASWTGPLLTLLVRLGVLSREEIEEHRELLTRGELQNILRQAGFSDLRSGYFEVFLNTWYVGTR